MSQDIFQLPQSRGEFLVLLHSLPQALPLPTHRDIVQSSELFANRRLTQLPVAVEHLHGYRSLVPSPDPLPADIFLLHAKLPAYLPKNHRRALGRKLPCRWLLASREQTTYPVPWISGGSLRLNDPHAISSISIPANCFCASGPDYSPVDFGFLLELVLCSDGRDTSRNNPCGH
jgi:hypothetical protein